MAKNVTTSEFDAAIKEGVVLVDFYADWCGPCKMLSPVLDELAADLGDKASVIKVNVDTESELAQKYQVSSIPAIKLFKNGELVQETMGFQPKAKLEEMINNAL
ncbi:MAG: thioredoxin [Erysipelothrix sp.]|nr:thioredoxin [Erysipelothrix sp.]